MSKSEKSIKKRGRPKKNKEKIKEIDLIADEPLAEKKNDLKKNKKSKIIQEEIEELNSEENNSEENNSEENNKPEFIPKKKVKFNDFNFDELDLDDIEDDDEEDEITPKIKPIRKLKTKRGRPKGSKKKVVKNEEKKSVGDYFNTTDKLMLGALALGTIYLFKY